MKTFALLFLVFSLAECQSRYNHVVTTGYSKTFNTFSFFDSNLDQPRESEAEDNLTFMTYDEELEQLFAVHEVVTYESNNTAAVSRWKVGQDVNGNPTFTKLQVGLTSGTGACHLLVDRKYGYLYTANYGGGSFTAFHIDKETGEILDGYFYSRNFGDGSHVVPDRQGESHPHGAFAFKNFVYVPDLGADKIWHFQVKEDGDFGTAEPEFTSTPPGSGPRHMVIDDERQLAYILYELKSLIQIFQIDPTTGTLALFSEVDLLAGSPIPSEVWDNPYQNAAEVEVHPNGKWMYFSNRIGTGAVIAFEVLEDGNLSFLQFTFTSGLIPRHFKIHPDGEHLLVANQDGNSVEVFSIDQETGRLSRVQEIESNNSPTVLVFLP